MQISKAKPNKRKQFLFVAFVILVWIWAAMGAKVNPLEFIRGLPYMVSFVERMFPPDFSDLPKFLAASLETLQIAIMGTSIAVVFALPLSFMASRNFAPNSLIYFLTRLAFNGLRGISEIVWGLLFVSMVGLGPFAGVLALAAHETGALGKYFSESIESVNPNIIDAIRSTGAGTTIVIFRGILPELRPLILSYILYFFEHSIRAATVLGFVGAGGIGLFLLTRIQLFRYREVTALLIVMLALITTIDLISAFVRGKFLNNNKKLWRL
jgi:phosphonate transport system permease protein